MKCWIQKSDYSVDERDNVSAEETVRMFENVDWLAELRHRDLNSEGKRDCAPGIIVTNSMNLTKPGSRHIHISPVDERMCHVNHETTSQHRFLGILPPLQFEKNYRDFPLSEVPKLLRLFFDGREEEILNKR